VTRPIVLLTHPIHPDAMARMAGVAQLRVAADHSEAGLVAAVSDAVALVVRMPISRAVIEAGHRLKLVARHGVGVDYIPVETCAQRGIAVTITPDANTQSVAEWVIGAMLALAHRFGPATRRARDGRWLERDGLTGIELRGRTLGVVGYGRIGSRLAAMSQSALEMRVVAYDPYRKPEEMQASAVQWHDLDDLLGIADVVSLHAPATAETINLIDRARLEQMKQGAILINAARGALVDTEAVVEALASGRLGGLAVDGIRDEPPEADHPLFEFDNVIITPHSAALTEEALRKMGEAAADEVLRVVAGQPPLNPVK
jgi:D-3-phosphoglycerate dehydrogenase / 2-oxoglutarate reductase